MTSASDGSAVADPGADRGRGTPSARRKRPSPESAAGGGLAWLRTGDVIRIDLAAGRCDMLVADKEIERRKAAGVPPVPESATPWQELYRATVGQLDRGAVMELAVKYQGVARRTPRHNH